VELGLATGIAEQGDDDGAMALARSFKALTRLKSVPSILKNDDDEPEDAELGCSCYCAPCSDGRCNECECRGCDATDCGAANCLCAGSSQATSDQAPLEIFEAELEAIELTLRT
jgi:hypothetical protein